MNKGEKLNVDAVSRMLGVPEVRILGLLKRRVLQQVAMVPTLYRFDKGISTIEGGTAIFCDGEIEIVRGFPKIQRAMLLYPTIKQRFTCKTVVVEEKMNGYNVRVARIRDKVLALTRGGLVCPYTTEKVRELLDQRFFQDNPDLVVCGEIVGPDNPYVPKSIYPIESVDFYVYDVRFKTSGTPLPVYAKRKLMEEYGIKCVRLFGEYSVEDAHLEVTKIIRGLGEVGREGVVIKDPEMIIPPIKYTSSQSNCSDLRYAFEFYNDYGRDFFFSRVVREGYQSVEWDEDEEALKKRCCQLGESLLRPMIKTIKKKKRGQRITEDVQIRVKGLETVNQFAEHLRRMGVDAIFEPPEQINKEYLVKIKKINQSTNDRTEAILSGQLWS